MIWQLLHSAPLEAASLAQADELIETAFDRLNRAAGAVEELPGRRPVGTGPARRVHLADRPGRRSPLTVAVDDLHHADAASLHCLLYVIRRFRRAPSRSCSPRPPPCAPPIPC
ncbi:hypothetical protein ACFQ60_10915 [Streptomyces zhihengii]